MTLWWDCLWEKEWGKCPKSHLWKDHLGEMFVSRGALLSKRANMTSFLWQQLFEMLGCPSFVSKKGGKIKGIFKHLEVNMQSSPVR